MDAENSRRKEETVAREGVGGESDSYAGAPAAGGRRVALNKRGVLLW